MSSYNTRNLSPVQDRPEIKAIKALESLTSLSPHAAQVLLELAEEEEAMLNELEQRYQREVVFKDQERSEMFGARLPEW